MKKIILIFIFTLITIFSFGQTLDMLAKSIQKSEYTYTNISFDNIDGYLYSYFILEGSDNQECSISIRNKGLLKIRMNMPSYNNLSEIFTKHSLHEPIIWMTKKDASKIIELLSNENDGNYKLSTLSLSASTSLTNINRIKLEVKKRGNIIRIFTSPIGNGSDLLYQYWVLTKSDVDQINYTLTKYIEYLNSK